MDKIVEIFESDIVKDAVSHLDKEETAKLEAFVMRFLIEVETSVELVKKAIEKDPQHTREIFTDLLEKGVLKQWLAQERR